MDPIITIILGGAGLGALGGLVRTLIGMKKGYVPETGLIIDKVSVAFNITFGLIGGGLAIGSGLINDPLGLVFAGYTGIDFIEGLFSKKAGEIDGKIKG